MAVTVSQTSSSTGTYNATGATTQNFTFTTAAGDEIAVFLIFQDSGSSNAITSVTWDSGGTNQACTLIKTQSAAGANGAVSAYAVMNPTVGSKTLAVVQALAVAMTAEMQTYTGTLHSTVALTCINAVSTTGATGTISSTQATNNIGDMCVGMFGAGATSNITATNNTNIFINNNSATKSSAANRAVGTGSSIALTATNSLAIANASLSFTIVQGPPGQALDTSKPMRVPSALSDASRSLNLELYKNPIPFGPYDYSVPPVRVRRSDFDKSLALNLNLYKNPIPFGPFGSVPAVSVPHAAPQAQSYNLPLYGVTPAAPFAPIDYNKPFQIRPAAPAQPYNLALYNDALTTQLRRRHLSPPYALPPFRPDASQGLNLNLFTNPIPFSNATSVSSPARPVAPPPAAYNQNIYAVVVTAAPFFNFVPVPPSPVRFYAPTSFNVPFYAVAVSPVPFSTPDYSAITPRLARAPDQVAYNPNIYAVVVTASPFVPMDFSRPFFPRTLTPDQQAFNAQLFTNPIPIFTTDYSAITPRIPRAPDHPAYNLNAYTVVVVAPPFVPIDYSKPFFPRVLPPDPPALNLQLFTNPIPFAQYDWSKPQATSRFLPDASIAINLALNFTVTAVPFAQYDWSRSALPNIPAPLIYQRDPTKFANPIPFAQLDWSKPMRGQLLLQPATATQKLPLGGTVVVSTELHARPFIGANMGWKPF